MLVMRHLEPEQLSVNSGTIPQHKSLIVAGISFTKIAIVHWWLKNGQIIQDRLKSKDENHQSTF